jgi:FixJ family two-component response regulator
MVFHFCFNFLIKLLCDCCFAGLEGILAGRSSKVIAHDLGISARTVEVHRARMLDRLAPAA